MLKKTNSCKHVGRYTKLLRMLSVKIHAKEHAPEVYNVNVARLSITAGG
ncbi:MAG: hypothetical protein N2V71_03355 [Methanophagales archaeon]|nr:hypothetical protein [Methanophagales archaeon]MCW3138392.1 hypothetical protein [Methanophagales archaeon]MCW3139640.1 hypothetical protein [Methanophagales archaeon]